MKNKKEKKRKKKVRDYQKKQELESEKIPTAETPIGPETPVHPKRSEGCPLQAKFKILLKSPVEKFQLLVLERQKD